jgi:hypothetical protein
MDTENWWSDTDGVKPEIVGKKLVVRPLGDGFGGLVVSMLAFGSRVRGFKPANSGKPLDFSRV